MTARRLIIIGRGKFAIDCLKIIRRTAPDCELSVLAEAEPATLGMTLARFCEREEIECLSFQQLNTEANINRALAFRADLGFSLNNFQIIKPLLLKAPREGFINFHNGPLPRYGGVNVCSWAIMNGESEFGVTWHFVDEGIDTGDIIAQRNFPIPDDATALSLTMECFQTGLQMLEKLAPVIANGSIPRQVQPQRGRSYFSKHDVPNDGHIDFSLSADQIDRFIRGLCYHPMPNPFIYPKFSYANAAFYVLGATKDTTVEHLQSAPGTIVAILENGVSIKCGDGLIILRELLDSEYKSITLGHFVEKYGAAVGETLH